jgi:adenosylhomocysteine nucleosidase
MRYGIIGAMPEEVAALKEKMTDITVDNLFGQEFIVGLLNGRNVVVTVSGIGKVAAAKTTTILIIKYHCERVINVGIAGGLQNINTLDIVLSTETIQHDVDVTAFGYKLGQLPSQPESFKSDETLLEKVYESATEVSQKYNLNIFKGTILTGDQFIAGKEKREFLDRNFPEALATEMEGGAIAQVCTSFNIPFVIIRTISDNANLKATMTYEEMLPIATRNSQEILLNFLSRK